MLGTGQLRAKAAEIAGDITSIASIFDENKKKYPTSKASSITNVLTYNDGSWQKSLGFAFQVVKVSIDKEGGECWFPASDWDEFVLQINPQEFTQDEIFAIEVTPTFRGVIVEHQGTLLKDISISGTTGVSPKKKEGGVLATSGKPVFASGHSGYEEFNELRSYFRMYAEYKRQNIDAFTKGGGEIRDELRLVFKNFKDNEYLYVEPQKFTMRRSASRPFMYDYQIQLKGIGIAQGFVKNGDNLGLLGSVLDGIEEAQNFVAFGIQVIEGGLGILRRIDANAENILLSPLRFINSALLTVKGGGSMFLGQYGITRRFVQNFQNEARRMSDLMGDSTGVDMTKYNFAKGRSSSLTPSSSSRKPTYEEMKILNGLNKTDMACSVLLSRNELFGLPSNDPVDAVVGTSGVTPNSYRKAVVLDGDTIGIIAARELRNFDAYKDLIVLNKLKPPYISDVRSDGVLIPGDTILIPSNVESIETGVKKGVDYNITSGMNDIEKSMGVDLRLDSNNDLVISNTNDLSMIAGADNIAQSLILKLALEAGDLKRHPTIGVSLNVGRKVVSGLLNEVRSKILASVASDSRIESVPYMDLKQDGGTTTLNMLVKIRGVEQPLALPVTVNNG